ncbi:hypothetical protein H4Q26_013338 [Puccinia striiformis f. sp. tritici PST-130]|nr:hypothetical protein H4Q26_013338 [Puccinia striiformis f. sp. tritici PST-130]
MDVIAYMLVHKLPKSMSDISQAITHSMKAVSPELVLDHLHVHCNEQQQSTLGSTSRLQSVSLYTDANKKCPSNAHNTLANHPAAKFWEMFPHPSTTDPEDEIEINERTVPSAEDHPEETEDQEADIHVKSEDFFGLESNASEDSEIEITQMLAPVPTSCHKTAQESGKRTQTRKDTASRSAVERQHSGPVQGTPRG